MTFAPSPIPGCLSALEVPQGGKNQYFLSGHCVFFFFHFVFMTLDLGKGWSHKHVECDILPFK